MNAPAHIHTPATAWIQTYSGGRIWPFDPNPLDIRIHDIAHALSNLCRYSGHCVSFYSVAEHCCHLFDVAETDEDAAWALLHDATEAYLVDVPRPLKPFLGGYYEAEERLMQAVAKRFQLSWPMPESVKILDTRILADERAQNMVPSSHEWSGMLEPLGVYLQFWSPAHAKAEFLTRFREIHR